MSINIKKHTWQPIPFYDSIRKQKYNANDCNGILHDRVLFTNFNILTDYETVTGIFLVNKCNGQEIDYTGVLATRSVVDNDNLYIAFETGFYETLPCGLYYWKIINGSNTWYSEVLKIETIINITPFEDKTIPVIRVPNLQTSLPFYPNSKAVIDSDYPIIVKSDELPDIIIKNVGIFIGIYLVAEGGAEIDISSYYSFSSIEYIGQTYRFSNVGYNDLGLCGKYQIKVIFFDNTYYSDWLLLDLFTINQEGDIEEGVGYDIIEDTLIVY